MTGTRAVFSTRASLLLLQSVGMADVRVPQQDGEISISFNGEPPTVFAVKKGRVSTDAFDLLLTHVAGAQLVKPEAPAKPTKE
jgi:hypothetical protein